MNQLAAISAGPPDSESQATTSGVQPGSLKFTRSWPPGLSAKRKGLMAFVLLASAYFAIEVVYVHRLPLVMDEFQGAAAVHALVEERPYRDFAPYKTVLGYYLQLPALLAGSDPWESMIYVKIWLAFLVALCMTVVSTTLAKFYKPSAVALALAMLFSMSTFLERSAELRVDMLTALAGLCGLVFLMRERYTLAGILTALSFFISQKGLYYLASAEFALALSWLTGYERKQVRNAFLRFNFGSASIALSYVVGWSIAADPGSVIQATFLKPRRVAFGAFYQIHSYWTQTLSRNPLYYILAAVSLPLLLAHWKRLHVGERLLLPYSLVLIALCLWHKQPWPYFFVLLIPTLFVLHAAILDRALSARWSVKVITVATVALSMLTSLSRVPAVLERDNGFQRETVTDLKTLLSSDETYLAGLALLYDRRQSLPELSWLDAPRSASLHDYSVPEIMDLIQRLDNTPTKAVVLSYRMHGIPLPLRHYLQSRFAHYSGCIHVYAPKISPGDFHLKFEGDYLISSQEPVAIDHQTIQPGEIVFLEEGAHHIESSNVTQLQWLSPDVLRDQSRCENLFPNVYQY